jgi:peptidoglycan/xylan/chitin deacetylase (PgdA/CDA1 family)
MVRVPILMYHYISTPPADGDKFIKDLAVTRENFETQVKWLKAQGYESITPDELIAALWHGKKLPAKPVMFTFDDGYIDAYYNAFPILKEAGYTGTFFVVTDWVDIAKPGYINWDMAKAMVQGGMYVQSHSRTHEDFRSRSHDWYVNEIIEPMEDIEAHTGVKPRFFCYPYGGYDTRTIWELQRAGFVAGFTENDSRYEYASNTMRLPRVRIRGSMTLEQFIGTLTDNR